MRKLMVLLTLIVLNANLFSFEMPHFELPDLTGKMVNSQQFKGNVILINFWATWCPPCKREIPDFIELYKKYKSQGFVVLGIALDDKASVEKFKNSYKINYPILLGTQNVVRQYGNIRGIPTSFLVGRDGKVVQKYDGYRPKEVFEKDIKTALNK